MDDTDRRLLTLLMADARASYADLGRRLGLSAPAVYDRVRRLERAEVITGYQALVRPAAIGRAVTALVGIEQTDSAEQDEVAERLRAVSEVEDCFVVAGAESFVLKVRVPDVDDLERTLGVLRRVPGVARTRTTVVLSTRWEGRRQPPAEPAGADRSSAPRDRGARRSGRATSG